MSLISDALRKADANADTATPGPSGRPLWFYRAILVGSVALVLIALGALTKHRGHSSSIPLPATSARLPQGSALGGQEARQTGPAAAGPAAQLSPSTSLGLALFRQAESGLNLHGIVHGGRGKSLALINDRVLEEGEMIGGSRIVRVEPDRVQLEEKGQVRTLKLSD